MLPEDFLPRTYLHVQPDSDKAQLSESNDRMNKLIDNIHKLVEDSTANTLIGVFSFCYAMIFVLIFIFRNRPMIQTRSPILMMIITFGLYGDSLCKIFIVKSDYTEIDIKCQLGIFSRVVFHYIAFFFIIIRIDRVK